MKRSRGLTMMELVFSMGLLFVAAGGVMTILVAGAGYPRRTQYVVVRDGLAKLKLDELLTGSTPPVFSGGYGPYPGNPDYEFRVDTQVTPFDVSSSWVQITVRGPKPMQVESSLRGLYVKPSGSSLLDAYGCLTCHTTGGGTGGSGPDLSLASLTQGNADRNAALGNVVNLDNYIKESVRTPNAFAVVPFDPLMTAYPNINDMPDEDLATITQYLKSL